MKKSVVIWILVAVLALGAAAGVTVMCVARTGAVKNPGSLYLARGTTFEALIDSLKAGEKLRFLCPFKHYAKRIGLDPDVKPGHYVLEKGQTIIDVARMLNLGEQTPVNVIVRQSRLPEILAGRVAGQLEADSMELAKAMSPIETFSMFIPNTYQMWWTATPEEFVERMKREYDRFWNQERKEKLGRVRLTQMEVMTLASILSEETNKTDEMPTMASVYINRLRTGMPLQADPTIKYAMGDFTLRRILNKHLKTPSPYNTYINKGLPPTPITMPSIAAIDAVLNYEDTKYLYFCAKEDFSGYHNFAATYAQHMVNARKWAAELNKRGIR